MDVVDSLIAKVSTLLIKPILFGTSYLVGLVMQFTGNKDEMEAKEIVYRVTASILTAPIMWAVDSKWELHKGLFCILTIYLTWRMYSIVEKVKSKDMKFLEKKADDLLSK